METITPEKWHRHIDQSRLPIMIVIGRFSLHTSFP
jgi:hypothetical protein